MVMGSSVFSIILLLLFVQHIESTNQVFDITKYGAKPDGRSDMTQSFLSAWKAACGSPVPSTLLIPKGVFAMNVVKISGPCKAPLEFKLLGTLKAPAKVADMHGSDGWITINYINSLTMTGGGVFDGQGAEAWKSNNCGKNIHCSTLPINLRFNFINNSIIQGVTTKDSKNFHVNVIGAYNLTFDHFTVSTPETSLNTDGIHLGRSTDIKIMNSNIQSGDDCVSIGDGTNQLLVEKVTCGPGHGFSIGSLGRNMGESDVVGVTFRNCTLTGTQNGVRIKSWPSSPPNYSCTVKDVHFEDIIMNNVQNPVIIDQEYCPWNQCDKRNPSRVKVVGISIKNVKGTFTSQDAVKFLCSPGFPCDKVEVGDIDLKYVGTIGEPVSLCHNVRPSLIGKQNPTICTTTAKPL